MYGYVHIYVQLSMCKYIHVYICVYNVCKYACMYVCMYKQLKERGHDFRRPGGGGEWDIRTVFKRGKGKEESQTW